MAPPVDTKKRKQRLYIMGAAGVALLLFLYMRSRQTATPNATSPADTQAAVNQAVQAQQAQDASMYGYGSYGTGSAGGPSAGVDLTPITTGLSQVDTDLQNLPGQIAATIQPPTQGAGAAPPPTQPPVATPPITINVNGQPAGTSPNQTVTVPANPPPLGVVTHPPTRPPKPPDPAGGGHYTWAGGKWVLIHAVGPGMWAPGPPSKAPITKTGSTSHKQPGRTKK